MPTSHQLEPIITKLRHIDALRQVSALLSWDQETMMPHQGIQARTHQLGTITGLIHDAWNDPGLADTMSKVMDLQTGQPYVNNPTQQAFVRELHAAWVRQTALSKPLAQALTEATSTAQHAWQDARKAKNFNIFAPHLKTVIDLTKEKIAELGHKNQPYDTLINEFEPGMTVTQLDALFDPLKSQTLAFLKDYTPPPCAGIQGPFDPQKQLAYASDLMIQMGYDTNRGRLDVSTHPFTMDIHPTDVRITTRCSPHNLFECISSTTHEVGHGLYEQGLDPEWAGTPMGAARSMAIHESQSRLWEVFIGQSMPFWIGQLPELHRYFKTTSLNTALDFFNAANHILPHWCRVESDIVTYNLHIMIRYECEKSLFDGSLEVKDLPMVWNQKMAEYLGLSIENDAQGCMQDVHWSAGLFGYFPSYTLGTLIAAELYQRLSNSLINLDQLIKNRNFEPILKWLNTHIHREGSKKTTPELLSGIGITLSADAFFFNIGHIIPDRLPATG